ncbi:hypothetical protein ABR738_00810 [Streptomyces sp. Edi4]|uniref:hypothetical protein n=1 Tax=Streptomyces sp. Edi4 TaxID=3162527 RepID=UPI0033056D18
MQHSAAVCQLDPAQKGGVDAFTTPPGDTAGADLPATGPDSATRFELVRGQAQDVLHTASRRCEPRDWLVALNWMIFEAQLHPKANRTTARVAMDLSSRMDYRRGIVLYRLVETASTLELDVATVKRHVSYLREMGALVWLQHGSKRNLRLPGRKYTATATVYGAVVPPAYDAARGHRLRGEGYEAKVIGRTEAARKQAVDNGVDNSRQKTAGRRLAPPSRGGPHNVPAAEVSGIGKATRSARAAKITPPKKSTLGHTVTARLYQAADRLARILRPLHTWTQRARISELSWVLVDKLAEGATEEQVDIWLREISPSVTAGLDWRPSRPHAYIASQLLQERELRLADEERQRDWDAATRPNADFATAVQESRTRQASGEEVADFGGLEGLDHETRARMRAEAWSAYKYAKDPGLVLTTYELLGPTAAAGLYGQELVSKCITLHAHANNPNLQLH